MIVTLVVSSSAVGVLAAVTVTVCVVVPPLAANELLAVEEVTVKYVLLELVWITGAANVAAKVSLSFTTV